MVDCYKFFELWAFKFETLTGTCFAIDPRKLFSPVPQAVNVETPLEVV